MLIEFFELYGKNFGYDETGISLREGGYYYSKEDKGWSNERQRYLLSIEDPQDTCAYFSSILLILFELLS